jgi:hypothetical protein
MIFAARDAQLLSFREAAEPLSADHSTCRWRCGRNGSASSPMAANCSSPGRGPRCGRRSLSVPRRGRPETVLAGTGAGGDDGSLDAGR